MFCNQCGQPLVIGANFCGGCGAKVAGTTGKEEILQSIATALSPYPGIVLTWGKKADLEISNVLADANWNVGKKKVEYSACLVVDAATQSVTFWEMIKEESRGLGAFFSFKKETYRSDGKVISGTVRETGYGFGDKVIDYDWNYAQLRAHLENVVRNRGWQFKTVLMKNKASY
jgi:hypothetical protein